MKNRHFRKKFPFFTIERGGGIPHDFCWRGGNVPLFLYIRIASVFKLFSNDFGYKSWLFSLSEKCWIRIRIRMNFWSGSRSESTKPKDPGWSLLPMGDCPLPRILSPRIPLPRILLPRIPFTTNSFSHESHLHESCYHEIQFTKNSQEFHRLMGISK